MKPSKLMIEITFILLAGFITVGLSINSLLKSNRQENELKLKQEELDKAQRQIIEKQNSLIEFQKNSSEELKAKSNEVIQLQGLLQDKSDSQLNELTRIQNPIPDKLKITFASELILDAQQFKEINNALKLVRPHGGNHLPVDFNISNRGVDKINSLKDINFRLTINFLNGNKKMSIILNQIPQYSGYNTSNTNDVFMLSAQEEKQEIAFHGLFLTTDKISCNYQSPSLLDFKDAEVKINVDFSYPQVLLMGNVPTKFYTVNPNLNKINLSSVILYDRNYMIELTDIKKVSDNTFETKFKFK